MNVRIIATASFPDGMAATSRIRCYAKAIQSNGVKVDIVSVNGSDNNSNHFFYYRNIYSGIPYLNLLNKSKFSNRWLNYAWSSISTFILVLHTLFTMHKFDICFIYVSDAWPKVLLLPFLKLAEKKSVYELNEYPYATEGKKITRYKWIKAYLRWVTFHMVFPLLDGVIAISERLEAVAKQYLKNGKVLKIPVLTEVKPNELNFDAINKEEPYLFHAGSLSEQKDGIVKVFEAFATAHHKLLKEHGAKLSFYVTNNMTQPETWNKIESIIDSNKLKQYVHVTGFLSEETLQNYENNALALVINKPPTFQNRYNFPTKLSSYLSSGRPVIVGAEDLEINKFLINQINAIVVPPDDSKAMAEAICYIYEKPEAARQLAKEGRKTVRNHFYYKNQADRVTNFLEKI